MTSNGTQDVPLRHSIYFLPSIFFQVENTIFQVPKYRFETNELFHTMFTLPPSSADEREGDTEEKPLKLPGILEKDFAAFLHVLYPLSSSGSPYITATEEWTSALLLSDMWGFTNVRDVSIAELSKEKHKPPGPVNMMSLGEKFSVPRWFLKGCATLIEREEGLTLEEAKSVDIRTLLNIYKMREMKLKGSAYSTVTSEIQNSFGSLACCDDYPFPGWASPSNDWPSTPHKPLKAGKKSGQRGSVSWTTSTNDGWGV